MRDKILSMAAGRELDALVAEKVMGVPVTANKKRFKYTHIAPFSTNISAAWEVVEKIDPDNRILISDVIGGGFTCYIKWYRGGIDTMLVTATSPTAPEAICKAALLAVLDTATANAE